MRVLQPIHYSLLIAFRYCYLPLPSHKGLARQVTESVFASGGHAARHMPGSRPGNRAATAMADRDLMTLLKGCPEIRGGSTEIGEEMIARDLGLQL